MLSGETYFIATNCSDKLHEDIIRDQCGHIHGRAQHRNDALGFNIYPATCLASPAR